MSTFVAPIDDRETWLAARRAGIGASEIAAVMGISPWESPLSLYWRKVNGWDVAENEAMRNGTILEPAIAAWAADELDPNQNLTFEPAGLYAADERPWQLATPDRLVFLDVARVVSDEDGWLVVPVPPIAVCECKWTGTWDGWGEPGTDQIPIYYRAQVLWQCDVMDVHTWYLAVLGPSGFRWYTGRRDDRDIATMREYGRRFMHRIETADPPPIDDHAATVDILKRLHPDLTDDTAEIPADIAAGYARARAMARLAERLKDRYEAQLRQAMGSSRRATCGGRFVASRSVFDVAEHTVRGYTVDRLNPTRSKT